MGEEADIAREEDDENEGTCRMSASLLLNKHQSMALHSLPANG